MLDGVASKLRKEWLFSWLKDPRGYWHDTNMPDLRLTDQEAADVVAYLSTLRATKFDALAPVPKHAGIIARIAQELKVSEVSIFARRQ